MTKMKSNTRGSSGHNRDEALKVPDQLQISGEYMKRVTRERWQTGEMVQQIYRRFWDLGK